MTGKPAHSRFRGIAIAASAAIASLALFAPGAQAGPLVASAPDCTTGGDQIFMPWMDASYYALMNGGAFEDGASGWSLDGASVASGNESYHVHGSGDASSLSIPAGSSATSSTACVGLEHPYMRFFAKRTSGSPLSSLRVEVLFEDAAGDVHSLSVGTVTNTGSWQPTPQIAIVANLLPLLPGDHTPVAFKFTPQGSGDWRIDDVYVDPPRCC